MVGYPSTTLYLKHTLAAITALLCSACTNPNLSPPPASLHPRSPSQGVYLKEANQLIDSKGFKEELLTVVDLEKALFLNAFVNSFCESTSTNNENLQALFVDCQTACGGQSFVLSELLNVFGIEARLYNIYNVPIQGNHTMVEARIDGRWILLDPTFGTVMRHRETLLNLDEFRLLVLDGHDASTIVWQSPEVPLESISATAPLASYELGFKSASFPIEGYYTYETSGVYSPDSVVVLSADLFQNQSLSRIELGNPTPASISDAFLEFTNAILNGRINTRPISYLFHFLGHRGVQFRQRLRLHFSSFPGGSLFLVEI